MAEDRRGLAPDGVPASPLLIGLALLNVVTLILLGALLARTGALEERAAEAAASAEANAAAQAAELRSAIEDLDAASAADLEDLRTAILDELDTIRFRGVVPTDSSGVILERLEDLEASLGRIDEIGDTLARLEDRLDQICEGVPVC